MKQEEIKELVHKPEVMAWIKEHMTVSIAVEPCESCYGYNIYATAFLDKQEICNNESSI